MPYTWLRRNGPNPNNPSWEIPHRQLQGQSATALQLLNHMKESILCLQKCRHIAALEHKISTMCIHLPKLVYSAPVGIRLPGEATMQARSTTGTFKRHFCSGGLQGFEVWACGCDVDGLGLYLQLKAQALGFTWVNVSRLK